MEPKQLVSIFITLILGGALGFGGGYAIYSPQINNLKSNNALVNLNAPALANSISTKQDIINDLTSIGCRIVRVAEQGNIGFNCLNYIDFRDLAYKNTVVYLISQKDGDTFLVNDNGLYPCWYVKTDSTEPMAGKTQIRIDSVLLLGSGATGSHTGYSISLTNVGSLPATITSLVIGTYLDTSQGSVYSLDTNNRIEIGASVTLSDHQFVWSRGVSYVVGVRTGNNYGFRVVVTTPVI